MKLTRRFIPILLVIGCILSGFTLVVQQNLVKINSMQINIWPEYDRPSETLVIYRISLSPETKLPVQISLRIPRAAGTPYNVAMKDLDGLLYDLEYTLVSEGEWNRIVFITSSDELQVEYYDPTLQQVDTQRTFQYRWIGDYPIEDLNVVVQQPRTATGLVLDDSFGKGEVNPDDQLVYYTADLGKLEAGIGYTMSLSYNKTNDYVSARTVSIRPEGEYPIQKTFFQKISDVFKSVQESQNLIITGALVLFCLLLFFIVSVLAVGKFEKFGELKPGFRRRVEKERPSSEEAVYCYQCGKPAKPGDVYCRVCGSRLKLYE